MCFPLRAPSTSPNLSFYSNSDKELWSLRVRAGGGGVLPCLKFITLIPPPPPPRHLPPPLIPPCPITNSVGNLTIVPRYVVYSKHTDTHTQTNLYFLTTLYKVPTIMQKKTDENSFPLWGWEDLEGLFVWVGSRAR